MKGMDWAMLILLIGGIVLTVIFRCKIAQALPPLKFLCQGSGNAPGEPTENQPEYEPPSKAVKDIRDLAHVDPSKTDPEKAVAQYLKGRAKPVRSGPT